MKKGSGKNAGSRSRYLRTDTLSSLLACKIICRRQMIFVFKIKNYDDRWPTVFPVFVILIAMEVQQFPFIFSNQRGYRILRHLSFWIFWWLFMSLLYVFIPASTGLDYVQR